MTFQDIFRSNFLENIHAVSLLDMSIALLLAFMMGMFIFFIYKNSIDFSVSFYNYHEPSIYPCL